MRINPIIPIWLMVILCIGMLVLKQKGIKPYIRQIIIVILLFIVNLRIMIPDGKVDSGEQKLDAYVLFVVDDTISMLAGDYKGETERLTGVKKDCEKILDQLHGAKFSVISFHNDANVLSPFTYNVEFINNTIHSIRPLEELYARGSSINICKNKVLETLKNVRDKGDGRVILFFISDGEITNGDTLESFKEVSKYIDYGAVLGYGTEEGAVMRITSLFEEGETVVQDTLNYPYKEAISKIDEKNLKKMADDMGINYIYMNTGNQLDKTLKEIKGKVKVNIENMEGAGYVECYYWFVFPLVLLLIYEFIDNRIVRSVYRK